MKSKHRSVFNYAKALFAIQGGLEEKNATLTKMEKLCQEIEKESKALRFFKNPLVLKQEKNAVLKQCYRLLEDPLLDNFLSFLVKKNKISCLPLITKEYKRLLLQNSGKELATVIVAAPIDPPTKETISAKLETLLSKKVEISLKVDPKILGGFIVVTSGKILDLSIRQRLSRLSESLHATKF